jgi:hypothetical protein
MIQDRQFPACGNVIDYAEDIKNNVVMCGTLGRVIALQVTRIQPVPLSNL